MGRYAGRVTRYARWVGCLTDGQQGWILYQANQILVGRKEYYTEELNIYLDIIVSFELFKRFNSSIPQQYRALELESVISSTTPLCPTETPTTYPTLCQLTSTGRYYFAIIFYC